jgi:preprotein translocase subunit SecB
VSVFPQEGTKDMPMRGVGFDFEGVNIKAKVGTAIKQGQEEDPRDFLVTLEIAIDNKEGKPAPYNVDVGVIGLFNVSPSLPTERRNDLLTVNGASILYGAIREMVLTLTSRFAAGGLTLPGMNFEDDAPSARIAKSTSQVATPDKTKTPKATKAKSGRRRRVD